MKPLRFAIDTSHQVIARPQASGDRKGVQASIDDLVHLVRVADRAGIDSFWASEDPDGWDAIAVLSVLARETDRIRIGTGVLNPYFRHPSLIAASIATLDTLSDGRAFLGLGRGQTEWYRHALGMEVGSPLAALEESFGLLRQWWRQPWRAEASADASQFKITGWERAIGPIQEHVPIYLAAVGPKALSLAARHADGVVFNDLASVSYMEDAIRDVRRQAADVGRDPDVLSFFARAAVMITDDPEAVWERRKDTVSLIHALPGMDVLLVSPGFDIEAIMSEVRRVMRTEEVLDRGGNFLEIRRTGDFAAAREQIPTDLMRELVVAGTVDEVRARLRAFRETGVTDVFLATPPKGEPVEGLVEIVEALAGV
jgi:5,10-methylenetetrahydromethanopterin reductase